MQNGRHYVYRSTTEKLNDAFEHIEESGDTVIPPLYHVGGRDWVILCRKGASPDPDYSALVRDHTAALEKLGQVVARQDVYQATRDGLRAGIAAARGTGA